MWSAVVHILAHWADIFVVAGGLFGIAGTFLMANRHLNVKPGQIARHLFFAFADSHRAKAQIQVSEWSKENSLQSIRGFTLIGIGFLLQMIPSIWGLIG